MQLHDVHQGINKRKKRKRIGRGIGSGHGKTSTKGHKGHSSRQGFKYGALFEGGQMPLARRVPKRGFTNPFRVEYAIVNVRDLDRLGTGEPVTLESLVAAGAVKDERDGLKILGDGELTKPVTVRANKVSASAREKIEKAGGKIELIEVKAPKTPQRRKAEEKAAAAAAKGAKGAKA